MDWCPNDVTEPDDTCVDHQRKAATSSARPLPWLSAALHGALGGAIIGIDLSVDLVTWRAVGFGVLIGIWSAWGVIRGGREVRNG